MRKKIMQDPNLPNLTGMVISLTIKTPRLSTLCLVWKGSLIYNNSELRNV